MASDRPERGRALVLLPASVETQSGLSAVTVDSGGTRVISVVVTAYAYDIRLPTTEWHGQEPLVTTR